MSIVWMGDVPWLSLGPSEPSPEVQLTLRRWRNGMFGDPRFETSKRKAERLIMNSNFDLRDDG